MPSEHSPDVKFEIGHVLFIDIVGYSKLLINQQSEQMQNLREIVRGTEEFRTAEAEGKLLRLPTGDGGALVFRTSPEAPVRCALEISKDLKKHPELRVRMGIHSGAVNEITDLNEQANIAGAGINIAQRIMDCGDAGHILLSRHVAEDLEQYRQWQPYLHDLGECEVKHGVRVHAINLYTDNIGNPEVPEKFKPVAAGARRAVAERRRVSPSIIAILILVGIVSFLFWERGKPKTSAPLSTIPAKSIAVLPFENLSEEKANAFFTDGVQDEILTDLAKIADLKVISRTSVMQYKSGVARNLRKIGEELGVAHVVEGSVQRAANKSRVNAQLSMPGPTHISGRKPTIAIWPMSSPSKAKSRKPLPTSCRPSSRLTRRKPSSSRPPQTWRLSTFTAGRSHFFSRQVSARRRSQTCGRRLNFWMKR